MIGMTYTGNKVTYSTPKYPVGTWAWTRKKCWVCCLCSHACSNAKTHCYSYRL